MFKLGAHSAYKHITHRRHARIFAAQALGGPEKDNTKQKTTPSSTKNDSSDDSNHSVGLTATFAVAGGISLLILGGVLMRDQIKGFLDLFIDLVDNWGAGGYVAYIAVYALLELLAVPAIPLTMTAGAIFGVGLGTAVVSIAATIACTLAFLIARYVARDKILQYAAKNPKFAAIDRAIGKDSFRVVTLLRLSPLLPLAASNYLYGLTSVELGPYVLGSWLGMLPGTFAYVAAGMYGKGLLTGEGREGGGGGGMVGLEMWQIGLALGLTVVAIGYIGNLAKKAIEDLE
jgi:uncharacterized membrane protein YdjX (TVP38/TMEM64 family)